MRTYSLVTAALLLGCAAPLAALHSALSSGVHDADYYATRPDEPGTVRAYRLWKGTDPTLLTRILLANPHLLRFPPPEDDPPWYVEATQALLVLLKGRPDLVTRVMGFRGPHGVVTSLRKGITMAGPPDFTQACRKALRSLEHPAARDDVCRSALYGVAQKRPPNSVAGSRARRDAAA